jgi:asparagine synthase (glutamine-hydrolysing)
LGQDVVDRLSGIFAFGLWDAPKRRLLLARDPIGVKPLFYADDGRTLRFGSEIKAVLRDPETPRDFDPAALDAFFTFSYTPAPATGFRGVRQLLPGEVAEISASGLVRRRYWSSPYSPQASGVGFDAALGEFRERLDAAVGAQMVSDVGIGAFLSGGLDSAAIVRSMRSRDPTVRALSVGLDRKGFNELGLARETARRLEVDHLEQLVRVGDASILPAISKHLEEPTADSSALPVYLLCERAAELFKVALSGDGADEILAGYDTYAATRLAGYYRWIPGPLRRGLIRPLALRIPASKRKYSLREVADRFTYGAELGPGLDHCSWRVIFTQELKRRAYARQFMEEVSDRSPFEEYARHIAAVPDTREPLAGLLNADTEFHLANDMLVKVDRMSMAHGLEVRVPFLDVELVRYCANLPGHYKLRHGFRRKHILRESLRGAIPDSVLRAPKSGFNIPVDEWMRGSLGDLLRDVMRSVRVELSRFLEPVAVERMADDHRRGGAQLGHALFVTLMFSLWLHNAAHGWKPGDA